jgi:Immunoglobulin I-set domain.
MVSNDVQSALGLKFSIQCKASGNPTPSLSLHQDSNQLAAIIEQKDGEISATYEVKSAQKEDFKDIKCVAKNDLGKKNATVRLIEVGKYITV